MQSWGRGRSRGGVEGQGRFPWRTQADTVSVELTRADTVSVELGSVLEEGFSALWLQSVCMRTLVSVVL